MKALLLILALISAPVFAMVDPMTPEDFEVLKKVAAGESVGVSEEQNTRIYTAVKSEAAAQPQDLLALGASAQKVADKVNESGKADDESALKAVAIFKTLEANQINFNTHEHSEQEKDALKKIDALHQVIKSKL